MDNILKNIPKKHIYYREGDSIVLLHGDCLEILPLFEPKSVDLVLTDPPYGLGFEYTQFNDSPENLLNLLEAGFPQIIRVASRVVLTPGHTNIWKYPPAKWVMAWVYGTTNAMNPWGFTSWQPILCYGKDPFLANRMGARMDIIRDSVASQDNGHPCPKPISFITKLIERTSVLCSDVILDPFLGSGTTAVAAKNLGRKCIGIEIERKYLDIAVDRLRQEVLI